MKTIKLFGLLLLATLAVSSCSKDDDDDTAVDVSGLKYEMTYASFKMTGFEGQTYDSKSELENADEYKTIEFKADNKFYVEGLEDGTWSQSGSKVTVTGGDDDHAFVTNGDKLTEEYSILGVAIKYVYTKMQ